MNFLKLTVGKSYSKFLLIVLLSFIFSQAFAGFEIKKHTINNGGSTMTSASYQMTSSIAQVDASKTISSINYSINGGFWQEKDTTPKPDLIFNNGFE